MADFFTDETDDKGDPIIETRIPPHVKEALFQMVDKRVNKKLNDFCLMYGIPTKAEDGQDLFTWLKTFRKYGNKLIGVGFTTGAAGVFTLIAFLLSLYYGKG